jgi:DNA-binding NarL/FixJ family response regulator
MPDMLKVDVEARFTTRQRQVVELIARGCSNVEIADRLGISPRTAKAHADVLRTKLAVHRRRQIPAAFREATGQDPHDLASLEPAGGAPGNSGAFN